MLCAGCSDPPHEGQLVIDVNRTALRPDVTRMGFTVSKVLVFYDHAPAAPLHKDVDCRERASVTAETAGTAVSLDLTTTGRTYLGAVNVPAGTVKAVWLVLSEPRLTENGLVRPLHPSLNCDGEVDPACDGVVDGGEDPPEADLGVLRLASQDPAGVVIKEGSVTEIAASLDPTQDITHVHGYDKAKAGKSGKADGGTDPDGNGDLHGGRWILSQALPFVLVPPGSGTPVVPGEIVVRFKDGTSQSQIQTVLAQEHATIVSRWEPTHYYDIRLKNGTNEKTVLDDLRAMTAVQYAILNTYVSPLGKDPAFHAQVQWPQIGLNETYRGIDETSGWSVTTGSYQPVVAIVDLGVMVNHPDLVQNIFINVGEIPQQILDVVGDRNDDGRSDWRDLDYDGDGVVTYGDLDALNRLYDGKVCPAANSAPADRCDPLDLVNGDIDPETHLPCIKRRELNGEWHICYGWENGVDDESNGFVDDVSGWDFAARRDVVPAVQHGTTVAGIVGAAGFNDTAVAGVSWRVRLLPVGTLCFGLTHPTGTGGQQGAGGGGLACRSAVDEGVLYAAKMGADVINLSVGSYLTEAGTAGAGSFVPNRDLLDEPAAKYKAARRELAKELADMRDRAANSLIVVAAGNASADHGNPGVFAFPANMVGDNVLRVASVGASGHPDADRLSAFSDFGTGAYGIDIAAPGEWFVELTTDGSYAINACPDPVAGCSGTSYAAPMVTGTAALLLAHVPALRGHPCQLADRILRDADVDVGDIGGRLRYGGRRLDALHALTDSPREPHLLSCP